MSDGPLAPQELEEAEKYWVKESQKTLHDRLKKGELQKLSPFKDENGVIRVGGRVDEAALVSYDSKHPTVLLRGHWISSLITRHLHQIGPTGGATTVAKVRTKFWITRAHDLAKSAEMCNLPRIGSKGRNTIYGKSTKKPPQTIHASVLLHGMRLFWPLQSKNQQEQDRQALWSYLHLPEHESSTSGSRRRLFNNGVHPATAEILCHQGSTSFDAERQRFKISRHGT